MMIIYHVTISLEAAIEAQWVNWMKRVHVPDVLATGCFSNCQIGKVVEPPNAEVTYVLQYRCRSLEEYHRYRDQFAEALQKEHSDLFARRFRGSRQVLEAIAEVESSNV